MFFGKRVKLLFAIFSLLVTVTLILTFFINQNSKKSKKPSSQGATTSAKVAEKPAVVIPKLSLESIFATKSASLTGLDQNKIVTLVATGDIIPARGVNWYAVKNNDYTFNWKKTADFLKAGDITLINLEAPIFSGCPLATTGFTFCGSDKHIQGILSAGVDIASLANNHIGNYGAEGINKTIKLLTDSGVEYSGFDHLAVKEVKGIKFGFLSYNGVGVSIPQEAMATEIAESKKKVDVLIVSVHWGKEYESLPLTDGKISPDNPVEIGHLMIDSGADLVIGNHPHWVQGVELYQGKLITYAHGNFIFDQTWSEETQEGVVGTYTFYGKELIAAHYDPIKVGSNYQPDFVTGALKEKILTQMRSSSAQLSK